MNTLNARRTAWMLGFAGLTPFVAPAVLAVLGNPSWLHAQHTYGACILAFLGALHWGPALNGSARHPALLLSWGVVPSLLAWLTMQTAGAHTGIWLAASLIITLALDIVLARFHAWPTFYIQLRSVLTLVATVSLLVGGQNW